MSDTFTLLLGFGVVALAAARIGHWFSRIGLPSITGYIAAGALAGSFALDLVPTTAAADLRFVDEVALGVIAFVAGAELFLPDLRGRWRTIATMSGTIAVVAATVLAAAIYALTGVLSFTAGMAGTERLAVAILGAAVLLALSPPSTIAVIKEVGARGPFTSTVLSLTVVMDVVVVVAFATAASIAAGLLHGAGMDITFVGVLALDLVLAVGLGLALGRALGFVLGRRLPLPVTSVLVLGAGFGIYELTSFVKAWSIANLPFEVYLEPLLLTMVAGFTVANLTRFREDFEEVLHRIGPAVYVAFFTLTGLSLKLDTLLAVLPAAAVLFLVRMAAIAVGSNVGARLAGRDGLLRNRSWMALVTQAGIALGLAREAGVQFPELGAAFTTLIISVVVLNEVFGPMILRHVLQRSGEVDETAVPTDIAVYGVDHNALRLAETLAADGMRPVLVDDQLVHVTRARDTGAAATLLSGRAPEDLAALEPRPAVVVAMSGDDASNLEVCRAATEVGVSRTVARVADPALLDDFHDLGTLVIDPTAALVSLLEQAVRTPDTTRLVLHADDERDVEDVTIGRGNVAGRQLRELRLPDEVLVMGVGRRGHVLVPDGFTTLRRGDVVTLIGEPGALRAARAVLAEQDDVDPTRTAVTEPAQS